MPAPENASMKFDVIDPLHTSSIAQFGSKPAQIIFCPGAIRPLQERSAAAAGRAGTRKSMKARKRMRIV
jgi:hypothetical protein